MTNVARPDGAGWRFWSGMDAHQTSFALLFFAENLHQQVVFPLGFFQLTENTDNRPHVNVKHTEYLFVL